MKNNLLFDFTVDKAAQTVYITREFDAELSLVWDAFTIPEILDQWTAPKPFTAKTKHMDFKVGGRRFYAMVSPEGQERWAIQRYTSISPKTNFKMFNTFADKDENPEPYGSEWDHSFSEQDGVTTVNIRIYNESLERMERVVAMGFKEGFAATMTNLDQYIASQFLLRKQLKSGDAVRVTTYLNFPGNTEEAMNFYKKVFKTEFAGGGIKRFEEAPAGENHPPMPDNVKNMVLYCELPILAGHSLMASDAPKEFGMTVTQGNNMYICLEPESREETKRIFDELCAGGTIVMPLEDMFFGAYFGTVTDQYGINWMVNFQKK